ncbi:DUF7384 family protein [Halobaculum litoreum]|uniref:PIN domain-containing protein n=1 Tax=Halobaculum litoreum TaxID=3031998 RepID=A0ABD5XKH6_9EURY|nr:hypothetical protein [Halobaculum sp. DT92]
MERWDALFDRGESADADAETIRTTLRERRERASRTDRADDGDADTDAASGDRPSPSPARVVADADVLAADLLVGGDARAALDPLRAHSWTTLVASDALLADAEATIGDLAGAALAADWREKAGAWREPVGQPPGDHPALASAYRGGAMHVLSFDDRLTAAGTAAGLNDRFPVSVREPRAFAALFDAASLYPEVADGAYPGPDLDPRA